MASHVPTVWQSPYHKHIKMGYGKIAYEEIINTNHVHMIPFVYSTVT